MFPKWGDWDLQYTRKGLLKKQAQRALNVLLLVVVIAGPYILRRQSAGSSANLQGFSHIAGWYLKQALLGVSGLVNRAITMLPD